MRSQLRVMDDAITISNSCILPDGWTVNTLMEPHDSKPYNPDIANVFYRAGFIENWGQGIQKICDECQGIGAELPVYKLIGTTLRIRFQALESALIDQSKTQKRQNVKMSKRQGGVLDDVLVDRIMETLRKNPKITQVRLASALDVSPRTLQRKMDGLRAAGKIERVGGKRYGHWNVY